MTPAEVNLQVITPAMALLPGAMDTPAARVLMLAIGLQESRLSARYQVLQGRPGVRGPARGLWQFELGGTRGVWRHAASRYWLQRVCLARGVAFTPEAIHPRLEFDDVLAAAAARLLIFTDAGRLPGAQDEAGGWALYATRCWRPGKPHPEVWPANHRAARQAVLGAGA